MGISVKYCFDNPAWAAQRIDELEAQLVSKFFAPIGEAKMHTIAAATPEEVERALAFVDALDYAHGYTRWVDTMKVLAVALRARVPEASTYIEVTTAMEEAGMKEAKHQYNLPVTRASVYAIFNAMLQASRSMNHGGETNGKA